VRERSRSETEVMTDLARMWYGYKQGLKEQFELFDRAIAYLRAGNLDPQLRQQAKSGAHRLIGSLGTFGLPEGSEVARQIERLFGTDSHLSSQEIGQLDELVKSLQQIVEGEPQTASSVKLLAVDGDRDLSEQIETAASARGWQVEVATNLTDARKALIRQSPNLILLDLNFSTTEEDGLTFLAELTDQHPTIPIVVLSDRDRLPDRVEVARLGGRAFLPKPISLNRLLEAITDAIEQVRDQEAKILVVDDDCHLLSALSAMLEPWGLRAIGLEDPRQFWEVLEATNPDLLVLDIEMPEYSGFDLCQAVRADSRWGGIPILFLSAHRDAQTVRRVFAVGGDDYISKPIVDAELVARVLNRLERVRMQRRFYTT
jgi:DNA-binding response OmpR family regulator